MKKNIEDPLVSFELALLAAKKGFPQKERPSYLLVDYTLCNVFKENHNHLGHGDLIGFYIPERTVNAPTLTVLKRWFELEFQIIITTSYTQKGHYGHVFKDNTLAKMSDGYKITECFKTSDLLVEYLLKEALQLI